MLIGGKAFAGWSVFSTMANSAGEIFCGNLISWLTPDRSMVICSGSTASSLLSGLICAPTPTVILLPSLLRSTAAPFLPAITAIREYSSGAFVVALPPYQRKNASRLTTRVSGLGLGMTNATFCVVGVKRTQKSPASCQQRTINNRISSPPGKREIIEPTREGSITRATWKK